MVVICAEESERGKEIGRERLEGRGGVSDMGGERKHNNMQRGEGDSSN